MSEVSDAIQILVVSGKMLYLFSRLSMQTVMLTAKILNTLYLSKWQGSVSFARFRKIKGENIQFINISTEDSQILKYIEYEMKAHGILFAKMPDLCGGDGRTQYVISPDDMIKFKAFLLDHAVGKHKDVKVGPISPADYAQSGIAQDGAPTPQMQEFVRTREKKRISMQQNERQQNELQLPEIMERIRQQELEQGSMIISEAPIKTHDRWGMYRMPDGIHAVIIPKTDIIEDGQSKNTRAAVRDRKNYITIDLKTGQQQSVSGQAIREAFHLDKMRKAENFPEVVEQARNRDMQYRVGYFSQSPVASHNRWEMYQMPDSHQVVVIPKKDIVSGYIDMEQKQIHPPTASFRAGKTYLMIDMETGVQRLADGAEIKERLEAAGYYAEETRSKTEETREEAATKIEQTREEKQVIPSAARKAEPKKTQRASKTAGQAPETEEQKPAYTRVTINEKMFAGVENDCYVTRIPYTQEYLYTPEKDCTMYDDERTLSAYIFHDQYYTIENTYGMQIQVRGSEVKEHYDDKTRRNEKLGTAARKRTTDKPVKTDKPTEKKKISKR